MLANMFWAHFLGTYAFQTNKMLLDVALTSNSLMKTSVLVKLLWLCPFSLRGILWPKLRRVLMGVIQISLERRNINIVWPNELNAYVHKISTVKHFINKKFLYVFSKINCSSCGWKKVFENRIACRTLSSFLQQHAEVCCARASQ